MRVFWLDQELVIARLREGAERLAEEHPEIEEIWLFGSLARGEAGPGSDADLLVVLRESDVTFVERSARYQPAFCGIGVDVLAYTRPEMAVMQEEGNAFLRSILAERACLYCRREPPGAARR